MRKFLEQQRESVETNCKEKNDEIKKRMNAMKEHDKQRREAMKKKRS